MNNFYKKITIVFALILIVGLLSINFLPQEESRSHTYNSLRVGAGDDMTGVLLEEVLELYEGSSSQLIMEDYSFKDC